mmetsp:Transcript_120444/g.209036  ORF Transcript_120444/g.209036 Transcript_120444/m.209036 type:complete len:599 (+) Transcript_120444:61-1857(+)
MQPVSNQSFSMPNPLMPSGWELVGANNNGTQQQWTMVGNYSAGTVWQLTKKSQQGWNVVDTNLVQQMPAAMTPMKKPFGSMGGQQQQINPFVSGQQQTAADTKMVGQQQQTNPFLTPVAGPNLSGQQQQTMQQQMPASMPGAAQSTQPMMMMPPHPMMQQAPMPMDIDGDNTLQQSWQMVGTGGVQQTPTSKLELFAPAANMFSQQQQPIQQLPLYSVSAGQDGQVGKSMCQQAWTSLENQFSDTPRGPVQLFAPDSKVDKKLAVKLVGVVVTLHEGSSYDPMFREIKPTAAPGEEVRVYSLASSAVQLLHEYLSSIAAVPEDQPSWQSLVNDVREVPADTVVFNFECCSACGDHGFQQHHGFQQRGRASPTIPFIGFAVRSGWTVMCSDFSLKSLLADWSEEELGPNPFLRAGSCSSQFCLEFVPADLEQADVPQQLKVVGELCADQGKAYVKAMGNTILYTVNPRRTMTDRYNLKVLTVVTNQTMRDDTVSCSVGEGSGSKRGAAGHVILTYPEGGQLVTSMGHWIELTRVDTSLESVLRCAEQNFGAEEAERFRSGYMAQGSAVDQYRWIQSNACQYIQQSVPTRGLRMDSRAQF